MSYAYLFKYIIIGDTGKFISTILKLKFDLLDKIQTLSSLIRCRKVLPPSSIY